MTNVRRVNGQTVDLPHDRITRMKNMTQMADGGILFVDDADLRRFHHEDFRKNVLENSRANESRCRATDRTFCDSFP